MHIGIDFDNTIVCYDELFWQAARDGGLIPPEIPRSKESVRNALRQSGREEDWTLLQGVVYGARLQEAIAFPGVAEFFQVARSKGWRLYIISHKTRYPYAGPQYDLHLAAANWLRTHGFVGDSPWGISEEQVYFELEKAQKLDRIGVHACSVFIDDLPELLTDPEFPKDVQRLLFDPHSRHLTWPAQERFDAWANAAAALERLESRP